MQRLGDMRREPHLGLLICKAWVGCAELNVRDDAVIIPLSALDHHKRPLLNLLRRDDKPHPKIFLQPATDEITDLCSLFHKILLYLMSLQGRSPWHRPPGQVCSSPEAIS